MRPGLLPKAKTVPSLPSIQYPDVDDAAGPNRAGGDVVVEPVGGVVVAVVVVVEGFDVDRLGGHEEEAPPPNAQRDASSTLSMTLAYRMLGGMRLGIPSSIG